MIVPFPAHDDALTRTRFSIPLPLLYLPFSPSSNGKQTSGSGIRKFSNPTAA